MSYEYYSSLALVSSVVVYALAMFAHTAEWAAARRLGVAKPVARELIDVAAADMRRPELVEGLRTAPVEGRDQLHSTSVPDSENDHVASRRVEQFGRTGV